jgi:hypothetical protein
MNTAESPLHGLDRRSFLRTSLCIGTSLLLSPTLGFDETSASPRRPELPAPCTPNAWQKHGVVLEPTEPWEGDDIQNFTTRAEPLDNQRWRIWYSTSGRTNPCSIAYAEGVPGEPMKKTPALCSTGPAVDAPLAIGNLPGKWKPVQPVHLQLPNGRHRLYFWAHGPQICRYLAAESEDGRRYQVLNPLEGVLYHPNDRAAFGVPSPDGVMFRREKSPDRPADESAATTSLISNDATNVYRLPDGSFELYTVALVPVPKSDPAYIAEDNAPGYLRVVDRLVSGDGLHFEQRRRIIQRDANDFVDQQFYYLSMTPTSKGRVGMLGHYRCAAQTMDLECCFSPDGLTWYRPRRGAWIPRGNPPAPDCYGIYAASQLVNHNGLWHLFYTGVNSSHNGKHSHGKPRQVIMLATTRSIWA